ncbi:MAG: hypothetical protein ACJAUV_000217 [Flavobacteriales bacterium]|jgi:hypothetical protein
MGETNVIFSILGHVTQAKICIDDENWGMMDDAAHIYNNG